MNMATAQMFRVNQLAKDLGVKPKDIITMLEDSGLEGKKNTTTLDAEEFNLFFDSITSASQIKNIDGYMSGDTTIPAVKKSASAKAAAEKKAAEEAAAAAAAEKAAKEAEAAAKKKAEEEAAAAAAEKAAKEAEAAAKKKAEEEAAAAAAAEKAAKEAETAAKKKAEAAAADNSAVKRADRPVERSDRSAHTGDRPAPRGDRNDRRDGFQNRPGQQSGRPGDRSAQGDRFQNRDRGNNQNGRDRNDRRDGFQNRPGQSQSQNTQGGFKLSERDSRPGNPSGTIQKAKTQQTGPERKRTGGTRVVDTRTTSVDLSKYDERLENFVPDASSDNSSNRQKLKKQNTRDFRSAKNRDKERLAMERLRKQELEKAKKQPLKVSIPDEITVGELAARLKVTAAKVMKSLMMMGVMATVNQTIDYDTAYLVADEMGAVVTREVVVTIEEKLFSEEEDSAAELEERSPVVCVMGHVDHGKTSLLDAIRHTNVTSGEAGGITQHIGAYRVRVNDKDITFLDTPGHEAFTAMRARGAMATDIAILVVAADDGIMPQTVEAINHAKAAGVDIIVAINKMDKPAANIDAVKTALTNYNLVPEEWGGDVICVPVSALTRQGIDDLLESVLLVAEMKELKANPAKRAKGIVIEARLDKGRGPVATVLVQNGTLHSGDIVIAGTAVGRVRAMTNDRGEQLKAAGPSVPVEIIGLAEVPLAGDEFNSVEDERMARTLAEQRRTKAKEENFNANAKVNLDDLFAQIRDGVKELDIIVKADVGGSAEAVKASLEKISNEEVRVRVIHSAVGGITESDVMLAAASNAIIVGFNVRPDKSAIDSAERQNVDIRTYRIIYECIEEITAAMKGMLAPTYQEVLLGHCEVRQTIHVPNVGTVAGSYVQDGKITRNSQIRIVRDGIVVFEDKISSLRRFKDDVREVQQGYECGIGLEKYNDIKEGDILEAFIMEEVAR